MNCQRFDSKEEMGVAAARDGAKKMMKVQGEKGEVNIIVATGASQFEMLAALIGEEGIDWSQVTVFHLDEYVGLSIEHPASFRKYLKERFEDQLPSPVKAFHYINAEENPIAECDRVGALIVEAPIDVAFVGIDAGTSRDTSPSTELRTASAFRSSGTVQIIDPLFMICRTDIEIAFSGTASKLGNQPSPNCC